MLRYFYDYDTQNDMYLGIGTFLDGYSCGDATKDKAVLQYSIPHLFEWIGKKWNIIEFGAGSMSDAETLISSFDSYCYTAIDLNPNIEDFGQKLINEKFPNCKFEYRNLDFFQESELLTNVPAVGVCLGLTIGNITNNNINVEPKEKLTKVLSNIAAFLPDDSYMIVTTDVCQNGLTNIEYYDKKSWADFFLSPFYRMEKELPMKNFDPKGFNYKPHWVRESSLVAHLAIATKDQNFEINGKQVFISKGDEFHLYNSYRYNPATFENCARKAGLSMVHYWQEPPDTVRLYLFKKQPMPHMIMGQ